MKSRLLLPLAAIALAGCGAGVQSGVTVRVSPPYSFADQALHIVVDGLHARQLVRLDMRSTDARGTTWTSGATFRSDARGHLDLDQAPAISGSYHGVAGMGLVWSMRPAGGVRDSAGLYFWARDHPIDWNVVARIDGATVASRTVKRGLLNVPVQTRSADLDVAGSPVNCSRLGSRAHTRACS